VRPAAGLGPPPNREDLIAALCTRDLARARCVHDLMTLYRACGVDLAHPRTPGCFAARRAVAR
jgi:hypothetical protein